MPLISQNQLASELKFLSRVAVTVNGKPATDHDRHQFETVTLLRYGLEADLLGFADLCVSAHRRGVHTVKTVDLRSYATDYKYLKQEYLRHVQQGPVNWRRFKRDVAGQIQNKWILAALANLISSPLAALQWLSFDERLLLDTNDDLTEEIAAYKAADRALCRLVYDGELVGRLNNIICGWFGDFTFADTLPRPKFGPGAVADGSGRLPALTKAKISTYDSGIVRYLQQFWYVDDGELCIGRPGRACFTNRIIFRPKNALSHRIISAEPAWLSWLQQAIKAPLYDYIERHPGMNTWFSDQGRSRELCRLGSIDGSYATIDFTACSDSISSRLVDLLFRGTCLHDPLLLTRSTAAEMPDGSVVQLRKFAPMGSATCFVTMDTILLSIAELATRETFGRRSSPSDYCVYGDDVVIRSEAAATFQRYARDLGFLPNSTKTYDSTATASFYREACGVECLNGVDISPIRYSRFHEPVFGADPCAEQFITQNVSLMNELLLGGYFSARSVLWQAIMFAAGSKEASAVWHALLRVDVSDYQDFGSDGPICVLTPDGTATNYRAKTRFNRDLWRREYKVPYFTGQPRRYPETDADLAYLLWCFAADAHEPKDKLVSTDYLSTVAGLQDRKLFWGWFCPKE